MTAHYVDVSHHDRDRHGGPLDWGLTAFAGLGGVMCARATYGDPAGFHPITRYFAEMMVGARGAGYTMCGGYHNLITGDQASINRQVDWLRRELDAHGGTWAMCDVEPYAELVNNGLWPRWDDVRQFHDRWYAVDERVLAWYIPRWFWTASRPGQNLGGADLRVLQGPLVASAYRGGDGTAQQIYAAAGGDDRWPVAYGGRVAEIWQYSSAANVPGASGNTDVNAYRGTLAQLITLLGGEDDMTPAELLNTKLSNGFSINNALVTLLARVPTDLVGRMDTILAAAVDDVDRTVVLDPTVLADLQAIRADIAALPTAEETAEAVADEQHDRQAE